MEKDLDLRDIQLEAFKILLSFVDVCKKNNLTYYISGGTYLGAVRHKGFIPWDDDIDVAMPRKDFNHFIAIAKEQLPSEYSLNRFTVNSDSLWYVLKIENPCFHLLNCTAKRKMNVNLWIDVFPLDGLPENTLLRKIHCIHLLILRGLYKLAYFDLIVDYSNKNRPLYENIIIWISQYIKLSKFINGRKVMKKIDDTLSKYDFYNSKYIMNFMGSYKFKSIMNREEIYAEGREYDFEGVKLNGPKDYDAYLKKIYGEYMQLPPVNQRNWHKTVIIQNRKII